MEVITLKADNGLIGDMDAALKKHRYTTRTEFIRDAIRCKLSDLEKKEAIRKLEAFKGSLKGHAKMSLEEAKRQAIAELMEKHNLSLD